METNLPRINAARLEQSLFELARFGVNAQGGLDRTTFTAAELEARDWLKERLRELSLEVRVDQAANIWARRPGSEPGLPSIAFGSHIDTVPNGGMYDGALGVMIALELMRVLTENGMITRHPLELVSFSAEEPNPFGLSTFGSRAVAGKLKAAHIAGVADTDGRALDEALRSAGGDPDRFGEAAIPPGQISAFMEVHIEQGKRLLKADIPVGVVTAITGIYREVVTVSGVANHAGTTLMEDRCDALAAASEMIVALEAACRSHPAAETVGTVGRLTVSPNAANIIPAKAEFIVEIRGKSREEIGEALREWEARAEEIARERGVVAEREVMLDQHPALMDDTIIEVSRRQADKLGIPHCALGSMAGHDATHMASIARSGMLFVPSLDGKSHCPEEKSRMTDIEQAANVLLHAILELDRHLDRQERRGSAQ